MKRLLSLSMMFLACCVMAEKTEINAGPSAAPGKAGVFRLGNAGIVRIYVDKSIWEPEKKPAKFNSSSEKNDFLDRERLRKSIIDLIAISRKISGVQIEAATGSPAPDDKNQSILIGEIARKKFGDCGASFEGRQAYRIVITDNQIGLIGESDLAVSYAVYELLDKLGCRWFFPGEAGQYLPRLDKIEWPVCDYTNHPFTIYRNVWYADDDFKRRNRQGGIYINFGHALEIKYLSKEQLAAHPEWIGEVDGKKQTNRLKWSSVEAADAIADAIIKKHKHYAEDSYSLSPEDGINFDNSPADTALDAGDFDITLGGKIPSITDRLLVFCNRIAAKVTSQYPDVKFGVLAYANYTRPPVREKIHPAIIFQIAPITYARHHPMNDPKAPGSKELLELVKAWNRKDRALSYYAYAFNLADVAAPYPMIKKWSEDLPVIFAGNYRYWMPETVAAYETNFIAMYLGMRLSYDPKMKVSDILSDLYGKCYGNAAAAMQKYWMTADAGATETGEYAGCSFGFYKMFPPERMALMRKYMNEALSSDITRLEFERIELADWSLRTFEIFMKMRYDFAKGNFTDLVKDSERYKALIGELAERYQDNYAFSKAAWLKSMKLNTISQLYFNSFYKSIYDDANRIAREYKIITPPIRHWKYLYGSSSDSYTQVNFDDSKWQNVDSAVDTWADSGHIYDFGRIYYRAKVSLGNPDKSKKTYLWISSVDDEVEVYVNGVAVPYSEKAGSARGFVMPFSFDISQQVKAGDNQITLVATRSNTVNEVGTGGLMGPAVIYTSK